MIKLVLAITAASITALEDMLDSVEEQIADLDNDIDDLEFCDTAEEENRLNHLEELRGDSENFRENLISAIDHLHETQYYLEIIGEA